jgi:hypothetical protein
MVSQSQLNESRLLWTPLLCNLAAADAQHSKRQYKARKLTIIAAAHSAKHKCSHVLLGCAVSGG